MLEAVVVETGRVPAALARAPEVDVEWAWVLRAYQDLSFSRTIGMASGPIPVSEIKAYCEFSDITSPDEKRVLLHLVRELDIEYLDHESKKLKESRDDGD